MSGAKRVGRYPHKMRERAPAVRMVFDHQHEYPSQWKAIESISKKGARRNIVQLGLRDCSLGGCLVLDG